MVASYECNLHHPEEFHLTVFADFTDPSPNVSPGSAMIVQSSLFRCGFTIESIATLLMIEQIPQLDDEIGARARSAWVGNTLRFANIPGILNKNSVLIASLSGRVKYLG
ncbi:MAG: hypothetical protein P8166_18635 [Candidatus Thiodiazotropha sp.]